MSKGCMKHVQSDSLVPAPGATHAQPWPCKKAKCRACQAAPSPGTWHRHCILAVTWRGRNRKTTWRMTNNVALATASSAIDFVSQQPHLVNEDPHGRSSHSFILFHLAFPEQGIYQRRPRLLGWDAVPAHFPGLRHWARCTNCRPYRTGTMRGISTDAFWFVLI